MPAARKVLCQAPVRVDLAGGWTDVAEFCADSPGHVLNLTIDRFVFAELTSRPAGVTIESADYGVRLPACSTGDLVFDGRLDLLKAALRRLPPAGGLALRTWSDVPPQSGLGTSAATGVAVLAALARWRAGAPLPPAELAELASSLEKDDLGIRGGKQDHYASAQGGIRFMTFHGARVASEELPLAPGMAAALESSLVLIFTGSDHDSGGIHQGVSAAWHAGERTVRDALERLKEVARLARGHLLAGDLRALAEAVGENWSLQQRLHRAMTTSAIDALFAAARRAGAWSGKACGAGGGGCVAFLCEPGAAARVRVALKAARAEVIEARIEPRGARVAETPSPAA
ncbi:MAG: hypothetical protein HY812_14010 [Planctomycetes bacterium]|nr:hypothetical protein [Planctomycetota bacterium]